jgi:hypothetical protein
VTWSGDAWTRRLPIWQWPGRTPGRHPQIASAASAWQSHRCSCGWRGRAHLAGVVEQVGFLASPVTGQSDEDIALGSDLRAAALMNLGTVEAWSLALGDAERHLQEGALLAREIGRPYLEVSCLAQLGFASKIGSLPLPSGAAVRR